MRYCMRNTCIGKNKYRIRYKTSIFQAIAEGFEEDLGQNQTKMKFKIAVDNDVFEELTVCNKVVNHITANESSSMLWIIAYEGQQKA